MRDLARLLDDRVAADPASPLVTFYDDATGERVELSAATMANWVAKSANLLVDAHGLTAGDRVAIALPTHWQTAVLLLASWRAGATVVSFDPRDAPRDLDALVAFVGVDALAAGVRAEETYGLALRPLGGRLAAVPAGVLDYAAEVPVHGDVFSGPRPDPAQPALIISGDQLSGVELVAACETHEGGRVLTDLPFATLAGIRTGLIGPLLTNGSVVLCRHLDPAALDRRVATERVTAIRRAPAAGS